MVFSLLFGRRHPNTTQTSRHHYHRRSNSPLAFLRVFPHRGTHPHPQEGEASLPITAINVMYINK